MASLPPGVCLFVVGRTRRTHRRAAALMLLALAWLLGPAVARAQPAPAAEAAPATTNDISNTPSALSAADVQQALAAIEAATDLDEATRKSALEAYRKALAELTAADTARRRQAQFEKRLEQAPAQTESATARAASLPEKATVNVAEGDDLTLISSMLKDVQDRLEHPETGLQARGAELEAENGRRSSRLVEIPKEIEQAQADLQTSETELAAPPADASSPALTKPMTTRWQAQRLRAQAELGALRAEQQWFQSAASAAWLIAQRDLVRRETTLAESERAQLQQVVDQFRQRNAAERLWTASREAASANPRLKPIAEENQSLAEEGKQIASDLQGIADRLTSVRDSVSEVEAESRRTHEMVEAVGLTESIGLLLRKQRARLVDTRGIETSIAELGEQIRASRLRLFELDESISRLADLTAAARGKLADLPADVSAEDRTRLTAEVETLLTRQRQLLTDLARDYSTYFEQMVLLENAERRWLEAARQSAQYIDERVLWIRTGSMLSLRHLNDAADALRWLSDPVAWGTVWQAWQADFVAYPIPYLSAALLLLIAVITRRILRTKLQELGRAALDPQCRDVIPTLRAMLITIALGATWPALVYFLGWRLGHNPGNGPFALSLAAGLMDAARLAFPLELARLTCLRYGLGPAHFDWNDALVRTSNRHLRWFAIAAPLLVGLLSLTVASEGERRVDSLGRLLFLLLAITVAIFARIVGRAALAATPAGESTHATRAIVWAGQIIPWGVFAMVWMGYLFTAIELSERFVHSIWLWLLLVGGRAFLQRWILLGRRRMAKLQAAEMRSKAESALRPSNDESPAGLFRMLDFGWADLRKDLSQIVAQVQRLADTLLIGAAIIGLWMIWADVIPAIGFLDQVTLWSSTVEQQVQTVNQDGTATVQNVLRVRAVTPRNVLFSVLLFVVSFIAARNVPGLIEVLLVQYTKADAGIRFAATHLTRYAIFVIGTVLACAQLGIIWSNIQWLVAAASVGLGFGLQDIFANFVSGLILVLERPIRVGDVVTLGDVTGTVTRIRFRSTTITDWDRKELIVPNKDLVTGKLVNWTLTDATNRLSIRVGVNYGADPQKVREILVQCALDHALVLREPAPSATLEGFGPSSLDFVLRLFLANLDNRLTVTHEIHAAIHTRLRAAGIEIPYPQTDLNIRGLPRSWVVQDGVPSTTGAPPASGTTTASGTTAAGSPTAAGGATTASGATTPNAPRGTEAPSSTNGAAAGHSAVS